MALIKFEDKPSTKTPWNADNVNHNFKELENKINEVYSVRETKTNKKWINNKPIYEVVLKFNPRSDALETIFRHGIQNIDEIIPTSCAHLHRKGGYKVPFSMCYPGDANSIIQWSIGWQYSPNEIHTWIGETMRNNIDTTNYGATAIIDYTKTTD